MSGAAEPLRFGLIGVDSSHATSFTRLFAGGEVAGGTVVAAWRGPTVTDFPPSRDRNEQLAAEVADLGVPLLNSPEAVAEVSDALLIVSSDQRTHPELVHRLSPSGIPMYVDTRFAPTRDEAVHMLAAAHGNDCLVLAGSPKRFTPEFRTAVAQLDGPPERIELDGPLPEMPHHPFLAWYGVHLVELAVAAYGPGCMLVDASDERVVLTWPGGRVATLRGSHEWHPHTRGTLRSARQSRSFDIEARAGMLRGLLESIVLACRTGTPNVPPAEILTTVSVVEAAARSRETGRPVTVDAEAAR